MHAEEIRSQTRPLIECGVWWSRVCMKSIVVSEQTTIFYRVRVSLSITVRESDLLRQPAAFSANFDNKHLLRCPSLGNSYGGSNAGTRLEHSR